MPTMIERWQEGYVLLVKQGLDWVKVRAFRTWELAWRYAEAEFHAR